MEDIECFAGFVDMSSESAAERINIILNALQAPHLIYPLCSLSDKVKANILTLCKNDQT